MHHRFLASIACVAVISMSLPAQPPGDPKWEVLVDGQIKMPLKDPHFTAGVRQLTWLVAKDPAAKPKAKVIGPEYLEFREEKSTAFKDGIVTFVPVASVERLEYEHDKKLVRVTVKQTGDKSLVLVGSTKFVGINKFNLDGAVAKAEIGVAGALQFQDGLIKVPFRGFAQQGARAVDMPQGREAVIIAQDKEKTEHKVQGLMPLYRVGAVQKLADVLMFQKVGQIDVAKIAVLRQLPPPDKKQNISHDYEVTGTDGDKQKLTLLENTQLDGAAKAVLVGLVGRGAAGFKLFPPHTISEVRFESK